MADETPEVAVMKTWPWYAVLAKQFGLGGLIVGAVGFALYQGCAWAGPKFIEPMGNQAVATMKTVAESSEQTTKTMAGMADTTKKLAECQDRMAKTQDKICETCEQQVKMLGELKSQVNELVTKKDSK